MTGTRARLLVVDDDPDVGPQKTRVDTLFANAIVRAGLVPGTWTTLHLASNQPFRSPKDLEQTLKLFETALWYRGEQPLVSTGLATYGAGIGPYLDAGGRMFIESRELISAWSSPGAFTRDFVSRYLNSDGVFLFPQTPDSSASWGLKSVPPVVLSCPGVADSLLNKRNLGGLRAFQTRNPAQALVVVPAHKLSQDNAFDMAVALNVPQAGGGQLIVDTYPIVSGSIDASPGDSTYVSHPFPQRASTVLLKILGLLGLSGP